VAPGQTISQQLCEANVTFSSWAGQPYLTGEHEVNPSSSMLTNSSLTPS